MAGTLNKVMLIGHTGDDVKMHYFEGGNCVGRFPVATNESYTNKATGERITNTDWHNIVVRNKAAEICEKYLKKGDLVYIEGRIRTRKWQDDKGIERYSTEILCNEFTFLNSKNEGGSGNTQAQNQPEQKPNPTASNNTTKEDEDNLPF